MDVGEPVSAITRLADAVAIMFSMCAGQDRGRLGHTLPEFRQGIRCETLLSSSPYRQQADTAAPQQDFGGFGSAPGHGSSLFEIQHCAECIPGWPIILPSGWLVMWDEVESWCGALHCGPRGTAQLEYCT